MTCRFVSSTWEMDVPDREPRAGQAYSECKKFSLYNSDATITFKDTYWKWLDFVVLCDEIYKIIGYVT